MSTLAWYATMLLILLLQAFSAGAQAVRVINPGGGTATPGSGLRIEIALDNNSGQTTKGAIQVYRLGNTESYSGAYSDQGINSSFIMKNVSLNTGSANIKPVICEISEVLGAGTTANPYRVNITGTLKIARFPFFTDANVTMTISYVKGDNYFITDYTVISPQSPSYKPYLYVSEYSVIQQDPTYPAADQDAPASSTCAKGFIDNTPHPTLVGQFKDLSTCPGTPAFTHVFVANNDKFDTYYAGDQYYRDDKVNYALSNIVNTVSGANKGLAAAVAMPQIDNANVASGTAVMVGYGADPTFADYAAIRSSVLTSRPTSTGSTPIQVEFATPTAMDDEGNAGNNHFPASLKLKVLTGGVLNAPSYINVKVNNPGTAVQGTDYDFEPGYMIPAGTYTAGQTIALQNVIIHGNDILQYNRDVTFELVPPVCSSLGLVSIGAATTCKYTIRDDEDRTLTLMVPASINEGNTVTGKVSLPGTVTVSEDTWVTLTTVAGTTATAADYTLPAKVLIPAGGHDADINITAVADKILEPTQILKFKVDAVVMGQAQTTTSTPINITDDTRNHPENLIISLVPDPAFTSFKEGNAGVLNVSLPTGVTTLIPITVNISQLSGVATAVADYKLLPSTGTITDHSFPVNLSLIADQRIEGDETLVLSAAGSDGTPTAFTAAPFSISIIDGDLPLKNPITLHLPVTSTNEGDTPGAEFWAELPTGLTTEIPITINLAAGSASTALPGSYVPFPASVTIVKDALASNHIFFSATANKVFDDTRDLIVDGSSLQTGITVGSSVTLTINDQTDVSQKKLTLTAVTTPLNEGDSTRFKIALPVGYTSAKDISIALTKNSVGTEASNSDFGFLQTAITLPKNTTSATTQYTVINAISDLIIEKDEILNISGAATGYQVGDASLVINDLTRRNPANTLLTFSALNTALNEVGNPTSTPVNFTLPAGVTTEIPITVDLSNTTGTATRNADYNLPAAVILNGPSGAGTALLNILPDMLVEGPENIHLAPGVSDAYSTPYTITPVPGLDFTIKDAQYPVTIILSSTPDPVLEGASSTLTATLPNSWIAGKDIVIALTKDVASTAGAGRYTSLPATVTIPATKGNGTAAIPLNTTTNNILDDDAYVIMKGNSGDPNMGTTNDTIFIKDNTINQPGAKNITLTPDMTLIPEGQTAKITVSIPYASAKDIYINLSADAASEATAALDYNLINTPLHLTPGTQTATFDVVKALSDMVLEKDESLTLLSSATTTSNIHYTVNNLSLHIKDLTRTDPNNRIITATTFKPSPLTEGDLGNMTFSLPAGVTTEVPITVNIPQTGGTAEAGLDYTLAVTTTFSSGNNTTTPLVIKHDNFTEGPETIQFTGTASDPIDPYQVNISNIVINDDPSQYPLPGPIIIKSSLAAIDEGGVPTILSVQLPNGLQAGQPIAVKIDKGAASTALATDHTALPASITILKGDNETASPVKLYAVADMILEDDQTVILKGTVTDPVFNSAVVKDTTIIIHDKTRDNPATGYIHLIAVTPGTHVLEGNTYTASVSLAPGVTSSKPFSVGLTLSAASVANASDITGLPSVVIIPVGQTSQTFTFTAKTDFILEKSELLRIVATPQTFTGMKADSLDVIIDDATHLDPSNLRVEMRIDSAVIHEGSNTAVTFGFINDQITSTDDIIINISRDAVASTADASDYSGLPAQVTLKAGQHSMIQQLHVIYDNILEGDEQVQFVAQLVTPGYTIQQPGMLLIPESGNMSVQLQKGTDAAEPATNGSFLIKFPGTSTAAADVKVVFYVSNIAGATNFAPIQTSAVIPVGKNSVSIPVNVIDNFVIEGDEQIAVSLMLAQMKRFGKNYVFNVNDQDTLKVLVHDDESNNSGQKAEDRKVIIEKIADATGVGKDGSFRVRFTDTRLTAVKDVVVNYSIAGSATPDNDYTKLSGSLIIPAGQNGLTTKVVQLKKNLSGDDLTVDLQLQSVSSNIAGVVWQTGPNAAAEVIIQDNGAIKIDLLAASPNVTEGGSVQITMKAARTSPVDLPVHIKLDHDAIRNVTLSEGLPASDGVIIMLPAGQLQHTFTATVADNDVNDDNGFLKLNVLPYQSDSNTPPYVHGHAPDPNVIILDNDSLAVSFSTNIDSVREGVSNTLSFGLTFNRKSSRAVTVNYDFGAATTTLPYSFKLYDATPGVDFDNSNKQLTVAAGQTTGTFPVKVLSFERNRKFDVKLVSMTVPSGQNVPVAKAPVAATGVILNDDPYCKLCDSNGDGVPDSVSQYITDRHWQDDDKGKIQVSPAISPNGDGMGNELMYIKNINKYPHNEVVVFNRWGGTVFKTANYNNRSNNFNGRSNAGGQVGVDVPDGSYFYSITIWTDGGKTERYTGFIVIKR
ncbi:gliding motility-associated C-terminal domain-containing protein [Chitinophaga niastensis]|nr:gliding motility-associated C-terminal domain-containing protein [Chitinophaga niastensis]